MFGFNNPPPKTLESITAVFTQAARDLRDLETTRREEANLQSEEMRELEAARAENLSEADQAASIRRRLETLVSA